MHKTSRKILRPDQARTLKELKISLGQGKKRPMIQCPTGWGKTVLGSAIVQGALSKGNRVIFTVPAISLINQTVESFRADGITGIGVLQGSHELTDVNKPVQVASVQTLMRRKIPHADVVIIDEAHELFQFYFKWFDEWNKIPFIGLSATPWTKGLGKLYDNLIIGGTIKQCIEDKILSEYRVFGRETVPDLSKARTQGGDYRENDSYEAMDKPELYADIVDNWLKNGEARYTFCFAVNCAHARNITERFEAVGVRCGYIDAYTSIEDREEISRKYHSREIQIVVSVGCLARGIDWKCQCIIWARPCKSEKFWVQGIGRGLRIDELDLLIFDHTPTTETLGYVDEIFHDHLDDGKPKKSNSSKEKKEKLPKKCSSCQFIKPAGVHECPNCGFAPQRQTDITEEKGELVELKPKGKKRTADKQEFYSGLVTYAMDKCRKEGWVAHTYKEYFGVWPKNMKWIRGEIIPECANFIKYKNIHYAKRRSA